MMRSTLLIVGILVLLPAAATAQGFEGDVKTMKINDTLVLNATMSNPLNVSDTYTVTFSGDALTRGIVVPNYPPDTSNRTCDIATDTCTIDIAAGSERDLDVTLEGTAIGQGRIVAQVNSSATRLSSKDSIEVRVKPNFAPTTVSAPGITLL
ncbi:MAG: hypothetical protein ABEK12_00215, partial [Candidatus Nanohaloarchaea archaeon]